MQSKTPINPWIDKPALDHYYARAGILKKKLYQGRAKARLK